MEWREYPDREALFLSLANKLTGELIQALRLNGAASLCVPGGTTPGPLFDLLSGVDLEWEHISVVLNDERWVAEDSPRSNTALLRARLLRGRAAQARLLPLRADAPTPEEALESLSAAIAPHLPLTCVVLGMGEDMHTASLFPGGDRLADALAADAPVLIPMRAPGAEEPRVTLTAPVLAGAMHIHLLILGQAKRDALERAQGLPADLAPVRAVLDNATVHWAE
ncbi:MAG: 6-phosphogluconolactonase [Gemmobacter sp.]|jgi:6-phosphogluconolactonase|nr:6-phosphogluconolactonase [Gemmobacter sp.]